MWVLWLGLSYLIVGAVGYYLKNLKLKEKKTESHWVVFKSLFWYMLVGLFGMIFLDLQSAGEPNLPALGILVLVLGVLYPLKFFGSREMLEVYAVYFGVIFYLNPSLALTVLGLAGEVFLVTRDRLGGLVLFVGLIPILFIYAQLHQYFIWSTTLVEVLILFSLHQQLRERLFRGQKI